jgi:hypothetical protein
VGPGPPRLLIGSQLIKAQSLGSVASHSNIKVLTPVQTLGLFTFLNVFLLSSQKNFTNLFIILPQILFTFINNLDSRSYLNYLYLINQQ